MKRRLYWGLVVGVPVVLAVGWALLTPAGIVGSLAGVCIIVGIVIVFIGIGFAGDIDTAGERMLPGASLEQMAMDEPQRREPKRRWEGTRRIAMGLAYVAVGAFLYWLK